MSQASAVEVDTGSPDVQLELCTFALAAVARSIGPSVLESDQRPECAYLLGLWRTTGHSVDWESALLQYLEAPAPSDLPLIRLAKQLEFSLVEILAVALATAVEHDLMPGRALAYVQAPISGSRPTLGLLATALKSVEACDEPLDELLTGPALRCGLLQLAGDGLPLPERQISVPPHLCLALRQKDGQVPGTCIGLDRSAQVVFPDSALQEARRLALALRDSPGQAALVMRCGSIAEAKSLSAFMCEVLERRPLFIETEDRVGIGPWLLLRDLIPVHCFRLAPGERKSIPSFPGYQGVQLAACGPDGTVDSPGGATTSWVVPMPNKEERRELWFTALGDRDLAETLSGQHRHRCERIGQLARLARFQQKLSGRAEPTLDDVYEASWAGSAGELDSLAQPLRDPVPDEALITTKSLRRDLLALLLRCRARDGLADHLGISATTRYHPGTRALFIGPSGTGKTLAAGWLATQLRLPLYRVDLAAVTSKYIGETEKNLSQLFSIAEQTEVVLLFDEADSLFGKRTEVEHANDRFANAQTNYLLQRIESFDGITILTSNSRDRFDPAFARRLDLIVEFPYHAADDRRKLWRAHLGKGHVLSSSQINKLSALADLTGGHIRNIVFAAAASASEQQRPLDYQDIIGGMESEFRKIGQQMPVELRRLG